MVLQTLRQAAVVSAETGNVGMHLNVLVLWVWIHAAGQALHALGEFAGWGESYSILALRLNWVYELRKLSQFIQWFTKC